MIGHPQERSPNGFVNLASIIHLVHVMANRAARVIQMIQH